MQALIVIDVQQGFDDPVWGRTTNLEAEERVAELVDRWSGGGRGPLVLVRHDSISPRSPLHPGSDGNRLKSFLDPDDADLLIAKTVNSAFYGQPDLHAWLSARGIRELLLCGIQTNMCVETTARMGGNLGYAVTVALDATRTFDLTSTLPDGTEATLSAEDLMRATAINLQAGGFAEVTSTRRILSAA